MNKLIVIPLIIVFFLRQIIILNANDDTYINTSNIILVGGCALNKTAVGKLENVWDDIWVPKNPGDPGSCIGAVLAKYHKHIDNSNEMWYNKEHGKTE